MRCLLPGHIHCIFQSRDCRCFQSYRKLSVNCFHDGSNATSLTLSFAFLFEKMDFVIPEDAMVYEAIQRFAAYSIGALAVTNAKGKIIGIVSERDYISKVLPVGDVLWRHGLLRRWHGVIVLPLHQQICISYASEFVVCGLGFRANRPVLARACALPLESTF